MSFKLSTSFTAHSRDAVTEVYRCTVYRPRCTTRAVSRCTNLQGVGLGTASSAQ